MNNPENINQVKELEDTLKQYSEVNTQISKLKQKLHALQWQENQLNLLYMGMLSGFDGCADYMNIKEL
jgi:serine protease inhibitor